MDSESLFEVMNHDLPAAPRLNFNPSLQVSDKTIEPDNEFEDNKSGNKDNSKAAAAKDETPMEVDGDSGGGDKAKNETAAA